MTATREELGARIDSLAETHEGDAFVEAVEQLAEEVGPDGRPVLQEVLLERAREEEAFQDAIRERARVKGWTRRMLARLDSAGQDEQASRIAAAIQEGSEGREQLAREEEVLSSNRGRAAVVLDELSRHADSRVRGWVPAAAEQVLGADAARLILSLTRDSVPEVRVAAVAALTALGPDALRPALPDLRRRLRSEDAGERVAAMRALAAAGDAEALSTIEARAEAAESDEERREAAGALARIRAGGS